MDLSIAYAKLCTIEKDLQKLNGEHMKEKTPECIGDCTIQLLKDPTGFVRIVVDAYSKTQEERIIVLDNNSFEVLVQYMQKLVEKSHGCETLNFEKYETELPMDDEEAQE